MKMQRLLSLTRQAVDDYALIESGDKIAVGVSGGKDSLTLLYALHELKRFYPKPFDLCAVTVDLGFGNFDLTPVPWNMSRFRRKLEPFFLNRAANRIPARSVQSCAKAL